MGAFHTEKRLRPSDEAPPPPEYDDKRCISRIVVRRTDFGKIIGKGGAMVNQIKQKCGANIKGSEIDEENRIVVMSGTLKQVLECFELITDLLYNIYTQANVFSDSFAVHHLIDHSKAGRVVGAKGSNINAMKQKSGCSQIRIMKDPIMVNGQALRILIFEGSLTGVRKAHFLTQESILPDGVMDTVGDNVVPLTSITSYGVSADTVRQLTEIQAYLNEHGLRLTVSTMGETPVNHSAPHEDDTSDPNKLVFYIPKDSAGGVIGKGAGNLKAIMEEFGVNIYVDRDEYQSMRKVVVRSEDPAANESAKSKIMMMSEMMQQAAQPAPTVFASTAEGGAAMGGGDDSVVYSG